jgi:hypothetical protein
VGGWSVCRLDLDGLVVSSRGRVVGDFFTLSFLSLSLQNYTICAHAAHTRAQYFDGPSFSYGFTVQNTQPFVSPAQFLVGVASRTLIFFQLNSEASSVHRSCSPEERKKRERCTVSLYIDVINTSVSPPKVTCDLLQKGNPLGVCTLVDGTVPAISSDPCRSGT